MKFKLSKLAAAVVAAGAVGSASAVTVNPDNTGQVLIYPYYNVNNNFVTNVEIVNTKNEYKIVKIRLRESGNSQDVIDFNIYMSPFDVWKGVIRAVDRDGDGTPERANIQSADNTCTLPSNTALLTINGVSGLDLKNTGWDVAINRYQDVDDADAREGYIEVIEIGVIKNDAFVDMDGDGSTDGTADKRVVTGLKHANDVPADCSVVTNAWTNGTTVGADPSGASVANWGTFAPDSVTYVGDANAEAALSAPTGGLYGFVVLLNTPTGSAFIADATAIDHYSTVSQHFRPDDETNFLLPSLASGDVTSTLIVDAASDGALILSGWPSTIDATLNDGDDATPRSGTNPLPIAHVLQTESVMNSYFINPDFDGATEWVVTLPMKKHGIFNGKWANGSLTFDSSTGEFVCSTTNPGSPTVGTGTTEGINVCFKDREKDIQVTATMYNQEEAKLTPDFTVSPPEAGAKQTLSREVNVITFAATGSSILGAPVVNNLNPGVNFKAGWAQIDFATKCLRESDLADGSVGTTFITGGDAALPAAIGTASCGGPVVGFGAMQGRDFNVQAGTFFGETVEHRLMRNFTPNFDPSDLGS